MLLKFRKLIIHSPAGATHLDGKRWPKHQQPNDIRVVEITVKPGALTIWHAPGVIRHGEQKGTLKHDGDKVGEETRN
jgi:hypothetical protein